MTEPRLYSHSVQLQSIDFLEFIQAPVLSLIDADIKACRRFIHFIENFGFEKTDLEESDTHLGGLRTITFKYKRPIRKQLGSDSEINEEWVVVHIPILSLIPLPLLQITEAELEYGLHIISIVEESYSADQDQSSSETLVEPQEEICRLRCMVAPLDLAGSRGEYLHETLDLNLQVKVRIERSDIPAGIATLLNVMEDATYSTQKIAISLPEVVRVSVGETKQITAIVTEKRIKELTAKSDNPDIFTVKPATAPVEDEKAEFEITGVAKGAANLMVSGGGLKTGTAVVVELPSK